MLLSTACTRVTSQRAFNLNGGDTAIPTRIQNICLSHYVKVEDVFARLACMFSMTNTCSSYLIRYRYLQLDDVMADK